MGDYNRQSAAQGFYRNGLHLFEHPALKSAKIILVELSKF